MGNPIANCIVILASNKIEVPTCIQDGSKDVLEPIQISDFLKNIGCFGAGYFSVARSIRFGQALRDLLHEHIVKHSAVDSGETVLGVETLKRQYHSMQSLAHETGSERRRLSRLMQKLGYFPPGTTDAESGRLVFAADEVVSFIDDYGTAVPLTDVPKYLGASKHQTEILYAAEILTPLIPRNECGAVRNVVFSRRHLDEFLAKISSFSEVKDEVKSDLNTIAYACQ